MDFDSSHSRGFNFQENLQLGGRTAVEGTTTIGMQNSGYEKEQITRATIGQGEIITTDNSDLSSLNRDINKSQEITKDTITGALDFEVTFDNRLLNPNGGWQSIGKEKDNMKRNLLIAGYGAANTISNSVETVVGALSGNNDEGVFKTFQGKQTAQVVHLKMGGNKTVRDIINSIGAEDTKASDIQNGLNVGLDGATVYYNKNGDEAGFSHDGTDDRYINLATGKNTEVTNGTNTESLIFTNGHEIGHYISDNEGFADMVGNESVTAWNIINWIYGDSIDTSSSVTPETFANYNGVGNAPITNQGQLEQAVFLYSNNQRASSVPENERHNSFVQQQVRDDALDMEYLADKITEEEYLRRKEENHKMDALGGEIALGMLTMGGGAITSTAMKEGIKDIAQKVLAAKIGSALVASTFGAIGSTTTSYMDGERDLGKLGITAGVGASAAGLSSMIFKPTSVWGIANAAGAGGGVGNAITTYLNNPDSTIVDISNSGFKGFGISYISGLAAAPILMTGGGSMAAEVVAGGMGLGTGTTASAYMQTFFPSNSSNTTNQSTTNSNETKEKD